MRKVRNFADKHKILLYRKNEISPVNNLHELKGVAPIKKLKYSKSTHVNPY